MKRTKRHYSYQGSNLPSRYDVYAGDAVKYATVRPHPPAPVPVYDQQETQYQTTTQHPIETYLPTETRSQQCCSCGMGEPGVAGPQGPPGDPGIDGVPGNYIFVFQPHDVIIQATTVFLVRMPDRVNDLMKVHGALTVLQLPLVRLVLQVPKERQVIAVNPEMMDQMVDEGNQDPQVFLAEAVSADRLDSVAPPAVLELLKMFQLLQALLDLLGVLVNVEQREIQVEKVMMADQDLRDLQEILDDQVLLENKEVWVNPVQKVLLVLEVSVIIVQVSFDLIFPN